MANFPRKSISEINSQFAPTTLTFSEEASTAPMRGKAMDSMRGTLSNYWPTWTTSEGGKEIDIDFTIKLFDHYRKTEKDAKQIDPQALATDVTSLIEKIRQAQKNHPIEKKEIMFQHLEESLIECVFGSNFIEFAGLDRESTIRLCRCVFRDVHISAEEFDERSPEHAKALGIAAPTRNDILRSRQEVIQHAKAFNHILSEMVYCSKPMTEQLLKDTHKILCHGHDVNGGSYRTEEIAVRYGLKKRFQFMRVSAVPDRMAELCKEYNEDISKAVTSREIDPVELAARYCVLFVNIHPFEDGNGRMCRIILNVIMLKYAGVCIPIGEGGKEEDREAYLDLKRRAGNVFYQEDMSTDRVEETWHKEFQVVVAEKSKHQLTSLLRGLFSGKLVK